MFKWATDPRLSESDFQSDLFKPRHSHKRSVERKHPFMLLFSRGEEQHEAVCQRTECLSDRCVNTVRDTFTLLDACWYYSCCDMTGGTQRKEFEEFKIEGTHRRRLMWPRYPARMKRPLPHATLKNMHSRELHQLHNRLWYTSNARYEWLNKSFNDPNLP